MVITIIDKIDIIWIKITIYIIFSNLNITNKSKYFLPWEPHEQYEKAKIEHWKMNSPGWQVPNMLLEKSGEITPERMKRWC